MYVPHVPDAQVRPKAQSQPLLQLPAFATGALQAAGTPTVVSHRLGAGQQLSSNCHTHSVAASCNVVSDTGPLRSLLHLPPLHERLSPQAQPLLQSPSFGSGIVGQTAAGASSAGQLWARRAAFQLQLYKQQPLWSYVVQWQPEQNPPHEPAEHTRPEAHVQPLLQSSPFATSPGQAATQAHSSRSVFAGLESLCVTAAHTRLQ